MPDPSDIRKPRNAPLVLPSFRMLEVSHLANLLDIDPKAATALCEAMCVPLFYIREAAYYNEFTLERALYLLTCAGGPGFAAPKSSPILNSSKRHLPRKLDKVLKSRFEDPSLMIEMVAAQGRNMPGASRAAEILRATKQGKTGKKGTK